MVVKRGLETKLYMCLIVCVCVVVRWWWCVGVGVCVGGGGSGLWRTLWNQVLGRSRYIWLHIPIFLGLKAGASSKIGRGR